MTVTLILLLTSSSYPMTTTTPQNNRDHNNGKTKSVNFIIDIENIFTDYYFFYSFSLPKMGPNDASGVV
jgi:hypothetical protein